MTAFGHASRGPGASGRRVGAVGYLILGGLVVATVLLLLKDTAFAIVNTWYTSDAFNHGFLIIPIALYLAWTRREAAAAAVPAPNLLGTVIVVGAALVWLTGRATGTLVVQEFALVAILQALVLTIYGWSVFRALIFPLFYLFLAVPVGEALIPPLERATAYLSVSLLQISGIPVFSDGTIISVPNGNFYVAEECAGLRFLISSLALGVLFAGLIFRSWWRRILFLGVSIGVPVVANGVRAYGIILLSYVSDNRIAHGVDHITYGWIFFALVTFLVLSFGMVIRDRNEQELGRRRGPEPAWRRRSLTRFLLASLFALAPVIAAKAYGDYVERPPAARNVELKAPAAVGEFALRAEVEDHQAPEIANPDAAVNATYEGAGGRVYLHIGYYLRQRRGAEAVGSDQRVGGARAIIAAAGSLPATIGDQTITAQFERVAIGQRGRVIWYWYWVDGRLIGNPYLAKLLQLKAKLLGGTQPAAIIVIAADYDDNPAPAERTLQAFAQGLGTLRGLLERAGG